MSKIITSLDDILATAKSDIIEIAHHIDPRNGAVGTPHSHAVTFATHVSGDPADLALTYDKGQGYGVYRNVAWDKLEQIMANVEGGGDAVVTSTGRAAINVLLDHLPANSHIIVAPDDLYPGTRKRLNYLRDQGKIEVTYTESTPEALEAARKPNTRLILTEPLTNPRMLVSDLAAVTGFAKKHNILSAADNTVTPLVVRTLGDHDFDVAIHSLTKYVSGGNNSMAGALVTNKRRGDLAASFRNIRNMTGGIVAPEVAATIVDQAKEFPDRVGTHTKNALAVAHYLASRPEVAVVHYPALENNPGHALAKKQFAGIESGLGGLFSFELKGGNREVEQFLSGLEGSRNVILADSFGADVTMLSWYARQSAFFRAMPDEERINRYGITDPFLRVAIGRTSPERIIQSLERGLDSIRPHVSLGTQDAGLALRQ
jgi:cystathionine beta-lyase/cystathionine gamma-synthase